MSSLRARLSTALGADWIDDGVVLRPRLDAVNGGIRHAYREAGGTHQQRRALDPHQSGYYDVPRYRTEVERLLANANADALVVDIGCGDGRSTAMLLDAGARAIVGIDFNDIALAQLWQGLSAAARERVALVCAAIDADDVPALGADAALMLEVASVIADIRAPLRSAATMLRPGGRLLISDPAAEGLFVHALLNGDWDNLSRIGAERCYRDRVGDRAVDIHLRTPEEIAVAASAEGFEVIVSLSFPAQQALALHAARMSDGLGCFDAARVALEAAEYLHIPRLYVYHLRLRG